MGKRLVLITFFIMLMTSLSTPHLLVTADYLGPDRQREVCSRELDCCHYSYQNTNPICSTYGYNGSPCTCTINCVNCITGNDSCLNSVPVLQVQAHCGGTGWSQTDNWKSYEETCYNENLPEATITAELHCGLVGNESWCRSDVSIQLNATEPLSNEVITYFEGNAGEILCDPEDANSVSCFYPSEEGEGELFVWAHSSYGDTTRQTSIQFKVDTVLPEHNMNLPIPEGSHGWHQQPVLIEADFATDATSGLAYQEIQLGLNSRTSEPILVTEDGIHMLHLFSEDRAGNGQTSSQELRIDQTPPTINAELPISNGENGWYREQATFSFTAEDDTSGIGRMWYVLGEQEFENNSLLVDIDGIQTLQFFARDFAGNETTGEEITIHSDFTPPILSFISSPDESRTLHGTVAFSGKVDDTTSGVAVLYWRLDDGVLHPIAVSADGSWQFDWNTINGAGGKHDVTILVEDVAGNQSSWSGNYLISNKAPEVSVSDQWLIWESGTILVEQGDLPLQNVIIVITTELYGEQSWQYKIRETTWTHEFQWDRKINDIIMPPGEYTIKVTAIDTSGQRNSAIGQILIPQPPQPTATLTLTPTLIPTALKQINTAINSTATSVEYEIPLQTETPTPITIASPIPTILKKEQIEEESINYPLWLVMGLGFLLLFSLSTIIDPRPQALKKIERMIHNLQNRGNNE